MYVILCLNIVCALNSCLMSWSQLSPVEVTDSLLFDVKKNILYVRTESVTHNYIHKVIMRLLVRGVCKYVKMNYA